MKIKQTKSVKITRIMLILLPLFCMVAFKAAASGRDKVLIEFKQAPLEQALKKVEDVYNVAFTYDVAIFKNAEKISLAKKERTLNEVLNEVSTLTGLKFK